MDEIEIDGEINLQGSYVDVAGIKVFFLIIRISRNTFIY